MQKVMNMKAEEMVETLQDFEHNGLLRKGIHVFHVASLEYRTPQDFVELLLAGVSKSIAAAVLAKQCYSNEESPKVGFPYAVVIVYGPVINNNNSFLFMHDEQFSVYA